MRGRRTESSEAEQCAGRQTVERATAGGADALLYGVLDERMRDLVRELAPALFLHHEP